MVKINFINARRKRRKKVLKLAKGYFGSKSKLYKTAHEQVMRSLQYAYRDRRQKKRDFRKLWITRINAGCINYGISYSLFIHGLSLANVEINRKMLSDMAYHSPEVFQKYVSIAKTNLEDKKNKIKATSETNIQPKKVDQPKKVKPTITSKAILDNKIKEVVNNSELQNKISVDSLEKPVPKQDEFIKAENLDKDFSNNNKTSQVNMDANISKNLNVKVNDSISKKIENQKVETALDLDTMLLSDLKKIAKEKNIKNISKLKKQEVIDFLKKIM